MSRLFRFSWTAPARPAPRVGAGGDPRMLRTHLLAVLLASLACLLSQAKEYRADMLDLNRAVVVSPADLSGLG